MGGEPDPFEVMSIERSASQSEVKKQCTSNHRYKAHVSHHTLTGRLPLGSTPPSGLFSPFFLAGTLRSTPQSLYTPLEPCQAEFIHSNRIRLVPYFLLRLFLLWA
jgi:hypothetical protein